MLAGFETNWTRTAADRRQVKYTNLPPGNYTMMVRAASHMGKGPESTLQFAITALPAWYETTWFLLARVAIVCVFGLLILRIRTAYLRHREADLRTQVAERTAELAQKHAELQAANQQLALLARRDPLTGVFNRRHFMELAELEVVRSRRTGKGFAIFVADIDHFKKINDEHGHLAGDAVIRAAAEELAVTIRRTDVLARYGGEEFILMLPETDEPAALILAERMRLGIESLRVRHENQELSITLSIGVASSGAGETIDAVLERADRALYQAKNLGRNRIASAASAEQLKQQLWAMKE